METPPGESSDYFKTIVAVLIALVTVTGALVAWRASLANSSAGDADFAGLTATLNTEETRTLNKANLYANYQAYVSYVQYNELGNLVNADLKSAAPEAAPNLEHQKVEAWDLATANQYFFPSRYLDREGNYDTQRQLGEAWAEAGLGKDLNPEPHFTEADRLRIRANWLVGTITALAGALLLYTVAAEMNHVFKYVLALGGTLFLFAGVITALAVEVLMR